MGSIIQWINKKIFHLNLVQKLRDIINNVYYRNLLTRRNKKIDYLVAKIDQKEEKIKLLKAKASKDDRKMATALLTEFQKVPIHRYGSLTQGRLDWEEKWDKSKGKRVLMYALLDYSGSFYKWADAVNRHTEFAVRLVAFREHPFGYDYDLLLPFPDVLERSNIQQIIREADIIHFKDETGFFFNSNGLPQNIFSNFVGPKVYTAYGGYFRHYATDKSFQQYVLSFDARVAMTPDLIHPWFDGQYIPHAIDTDMYPYCWTDGQILAHSPSKKAKKGTDDLINAIQGMDIHFDLIHGVSHKECMLRKQNATLFFDQAGVSSFKNTGKIAVIGYYGNSALESAVFGIPTIAHISERAFEGARIAGRDIENICGIVNTPRGVDGIRKTVVEFFNLTSEERQKVSKQTRRWMEDFHSYHACAIELSKMYSRLLGMKSTHEGTTNVKTD